MRITRWLCFIGNLFASAAYVLLLTHVVFDAPAAGPLCAPCVCDYGPPPVGSDTDDTEVGCPPNASVSDPALWTPSDLVGLLNFCSDEHAWPRPHIHNGENSTTVPRVERAAPVLARLDRTYRLSNKAWSNRANGPKKTKFTSEEVVLIDAFDASKTDVATYATKNGGTLVLGYISAGSYEEWRDDAGKWPREAIGREYEGWAGENWLDLSRWELVKPVMLARLKMARDKGFAGVEFDNIATLDQFESEKDQRRFKPRAVAYARWLASTAHGLGLLAVFKNGGYMVADVVDDFDAVIAESALKYNEVQLYLPFVEQKKPVWLFEYNGNALSLAEKLLKTRVQVADALLETSKGWQRVA